MDSQRKERIGPIDKHHKFLKENEFIVQGYRLYFNSVGKIFKSLFLVHNETINIWTHALGTLLFFSLFCYLLLTTEDSSASLYMRDYLDRVSFDFREARTTIFNSITTFSLELHDSEIPESLKLMLSKTKTTIEKALLLHEEVLQIPNHQVNKWPIFIYILSTIICLSFSTLYHLFNAHSHHVKIWMNSLDYAGITVMMLGSFYPPIYYIFFCDELWVVIYLSVVSCLCIVVLIVTFNPIFQGLWVRVVIFLLLGACGVLPIGHMAFFTSEASHFTDAIFYYFLMGVLYMGGLTIYILKFPERYFHGKLDYIGNSHNIWHCMIMMGAVFYYFAAMESYYQRKSLTCSSS